MEDDGSGAELPEHASELQRALAAASAGIEAVDDRLSALFDRDQRPDNARGQFDVNSVMAAAGNADDIWAGPDDDDVIVLDDLYEEPEEFEDVDVHCAVDDTDEDDALLSLDAALAEEAPEDF
jgi:hypothetical protein